MHLHKWSVWVNQKSINYLRDGVKVGEGVMQYRDCLKCRKIQLRTAHA